MSDRPPDSLIPTVRPYWMKKRTIPEFAPYWETIKGAGFSETDLAKLRPLLEKRDAEMKHRVVAYMFAVFLDGTSCRDVDPDRLVPKEWRVD